MKQIIEKWYKDLGFSSIYDRDFYELLSAYTAEEDVSVDTYAYEKHDAQYNLLSYLYMCENMKKGYAEKGIGLDILYATLKDIRFYAQIWSELKGKLCLAGEYEWLKRHLGMRLFRLGRLQFCMGKSEHTIPEKGLFAGDNVLEIHIPDDGPLTPAACQASIEMAHTFFAKYFPEFQYKHFTCDSWLLDITIKDLLREGSNILAFQELFDITERKKSDRIFRYIFKWDSTRDNINNAFCKSKFAELVKARALAGGDFYEALGILKV